MAPVLVKLLSQIVPSGGGGERGRGDRGGRGGGRYICTSLNLDVK